METKNCIGCNKKYNSYPSAQRQYCSHQCHFTHTTNPMLGKHHTQETKQKIAAKAVIRTGTRNSFYGKHHTAQTIAIIREKNRKGLIRNCTDCQKPFYAKRFRLTHRNTQYCSNECRQKNTLTQGTRIELHIRNYLSQLCIDFVKNNCITLNGRRFYPDLYVPSMQLFIECDGDYWHGNPAQYPQPDIIQKRSMERDKHFESLCYENGFKLVRFWESDILNDFGKVKEVLSHHGINNTTAS